MITIGTLQDAARQRAVYKEDGAVFSYKGQMIVPADGDPRRPNAFLVEQEPGKLLKVHFHAGAQFQVVVRGSGRLGPHQLAPVTVHYAGQRTPYGPILPDADGPLWYLTLRPCYEAGLYWMPESRDLRDAIPRRELFGNAPVAGATGRVAAASTTLEEVIAPQDDGLSAWLLRIPAGVTAVAPRHQDSLGRYHVVVGGSMRLNAHDSGARELGWVSVIWTDAEDLPLEFSAGAAGCEVLILQFPLGAMDHPPPAKPATALLKP